MFYVQLFAHSVSTGKRLNQHVIEIDAPHTLFLVGGLEHEFYFSIWLGIS